MTYFSSSLKLGSRSFNRDFTAKNIIENKTFSNLPALLTTACKDPNEEMASLTTESQKSSPVISPLSIAISPKFGNIQCQTRITIIMKQRSDKACHLL